MRKRALIDKQGRVKLTLHCWATAAKRCTGTLILKLRAAGNTRGIANRRLTIASADTTMSACGSTAAPAGPSRPSTSCAAAATEPAVDALQQVPKFGAARSGLIKTITTLRAVGANAGADALDDGRHAIEIGMLAFIDAERPKSNQPVQLFMALLDGEVVAEEAKEMVLGTAAS